MKEGRKEGRKKRGPMLFCGIFTICKRFQKSSKEIDHKMPMCLYNNNTIKLKTILL
jgi:hypothetical protein